MRHVLETMAQREKENLQYTIVALGDSVTDGCLEPGVKNFDTVWHAQLTKLLRGVFPELRINCINSGIGGISTVASVDRLERDVFAYSPDLVIVCLGLNDLCGEQEAFLTALREILTRIREKGIDVIYLTPNMVDLSADREGILQLFHSEGIADFADMLAERQNDGRVDEFFRGAVQTAEACGAEVCDAYGAWRRLSDVGKDTTSLLINKINHPTPAMHSVFAALLLETILK